MIFSINNINSKFSITDDEWDSLEYFLKGGMMSERKMVPASPVSVKAEDMVAVTEIAREAHDSLNKLGYEDGELNSAGVDFDFLELAAITTTKSWRSASLTFTAEDIVDNVVRKTKERIEGCRRK